MLNDRHEAEQVQRIKRAGVQTSTTSQLISLQKNYVAYIEALKRQSLSPHTLRAYKLRLQHFLGFLGERLSKYPNALTDQQTSDHLAQDYKQYLKVNLKSSPQTINAYLTAIDSFYQYLGLGKASTSRERLRQLPPEVLTQDEQNDFLRAVQHCSNPRDRAIAILLLTTGIRITECAALNIKHVTLDLRKPAIKIHGRASHACRQISFNLQCGQELKNSLNERQRRYPHITDDALWISSRGKRLSVDSIDHLIRKLSLRAKLQTVSANTLRNTCLFNLANNNQDIATIAKFAGHKKLENNKAICTSASNLVMNSVSVLCKSLFHINRRSIDKSAMVSI